MNESCHASTWLWHKGPEGVGCLERGEKYTPCCNMLLCKEHYDKYIIKKSCCIENREFSNKK